MRVVRGIRSAVAGVFVVGMATIGFAVTAVSVGAGVGGPPPDGTAPDGGIRCEVEGGDGAGPVPAADLVQPTQDGREAECAQLEVTKTVTGTPAPAPPPGTTYDVVVDCVPVEDNGMPPKDGVEAEQAPPVQTPPFTTTLTFPEGGGTQSIFIDRPSDCMVTETAPPGCTLRSIDPGTTEIRSPILYGVTVTNNCDPPVEAGVAVAVVEVPRFTG